MNAEHLILAGNNQNSVDQELDCQISCVGMLSVFPLHA